MTTLEQILQQHFNCKHPFKKNGELSAQGWKAYRKLIDIVYDLCSIEAIDNADDVVETLDFIIKHE